MRILSRQEMQVAKQLLQKHIPKSLKVYGLLFAMNRNRPSTLEVLVDTWPEFKVVICRPDPQNERASEDKKVTLFCTDEQALRRMLREEPAIDWSTGFLVEGLDVSNAPMLREVLSERGAIMRNFTQVRLLHLPDCSALRPAAGGSELVSRMTSLNDSHVDLVNRTWKLGGDEKGLRTVRHLVRHFPSLCITDGRGAPLSWVLVYDYYAMGLLYTLPQHRGQGLASALVSSMARRLHARGFPVFGFVEEENLLSYSLLSSLGFTEDPSYRAAWFQVSLNRSRSKTPHPSSWVLPM